MQETYIPPGSLVLLELDYELYDSEDRQMISDYIEGLNASSCIVGMPGTSTQIKVLAPAESTSRYAVR